MKTVRTELDKEFNMFLNEMSRKLEAISNRAKSGKQIDIENQSFILWCQVDRTILLRKGII